MSASGRREALQREARRGGRCRAPRRGGGRRCAGALVLIALAATGAAAEELFGAASSEELVSRLRAALATGELAELVPLLIESERTTLATTAFVVAAQATPRFEEWIAPEVTAADRVRLAEESRDLADLRAILERRGLGHIFGAAPQPWEGPLLTDTDPAAVMQRLKESVGSDPAGLVKDLLAYLDRFATPGGASPADRLRSMMPRGELRDVELGAERGSARTDDTGVVLVREGDRWFANVFQVQVEARPREGGPGR